MPPGEQMFKFHGYSGPCPKPALSTLLSKAVIGYRVVERREAGYWIEVVVDRQQRREIGPFETRAEAYRAYADLLEVQRSLGAQDLPSQPS